MTTRANNLACAAGHEHRAPPYDQEDSLHRRIGAFRSSFFQRDSNDAPWRQFEQRVRTGPYALLRFPLQPYSPTRILDKQIARKVNHRLLSFIKSSPPRIREEWRLGSLSPAKDEAVIDHEFKISMKDMRKKIYFPRYPGNDWKKSRAGNKNSTDDGEKTDGSHCVFCLEEFVPNETVIVTPCNHSYHYDCISPWVKNGGTCPVCRNAFSEKKKEAFATQTNSNSSNATAGSGLPNELTVLIKAMEEAFDYIKYSN